MLRLSLRYHIDAEEAVVTIQGRDDVQFSDLRALLRGLLLDAQFSPTMPQLVDLRDCRIRLPARSITTIARFLSRRYAANVRAPVAVVIDQQLASRPTAALYRLTCAVRTAELFDDYGFAVRWMLGLTGKKPDSGAER